MFAIAILTGIYSYLIFILGLIGLLTSFYILFVSSPFFILSAIYFKQNFKNFISKAKIYRMISFPFLRTNKYILLLIGLFFLQMIINLIGALGPELAFDALWYHLSLPRIYLLNHSVFYLPGGLLYYSAMPKLIEMIYVAALSFNGEILAKLIHFSFGLITAIALYKLSRKFFSSKNSLLAVIIFYSNLVVGWESITAYVDLARTFFEIMALWGFLNWYEKKGKKWLIESAIVLGLSVTTKLLSLSSLFIFLILIFINYLIEKESLKKLFMNLFLFSSFVLLVPLPWFIFSFVQTGSPVFPFFSFIYKIQLESIKPFLFLTEIWNLFTKAADPISPVYLITMPLIFISFPKMKKELKLIAFYSCLAVITWYFTPRTGGGRFIMPYLPAFSIIVVGTVEQFKSNRLIKFISIGVVIMTCFASIFYRGVANAKYLPVIFGMQTKDQFLTKNLNFSYGDFYDMDNYFKKNIKLYDKVLLYGFHNLYYVDFPFIDSSWVKKGDVFNYVAVQNAELPKRFENWQLIYQNKKTFVKLYSLGGEKWNY